MKSYSERTLGLAERFLDEVKLDVERDASEGMDTPPRLRVVHERPGHATPEYRTMTLPLPNGGEPFPEFLSGTIARYAREKLPDRLILALEVVQPDESGAARPVIIAEARDRRGTRLFLLQPYRVAGSQVEWGKPAGDGWRDPGAEDLILDQAFEEG
ncbi:MAG: hypothetical protein ACREKN_09785 [Longimicrobiaceae bacterium]